ncbi:MAG: translation initiation factor [Chitinophagaceae bacterium]
MSKRKSLNSGGIVFSTDPAFKLHNIEEVKIEQLEAAQQKLKVRLDTKQRAGKSVTLVDGFIGKDDEITELGKQLKSFCGTGGSVKDGMIIIQGDQREKVVQWLTKNGYKNTKRIN